MDGAESIRSGRSERSHRSHHSHRHNHGSSRSDHGDPNRYHHRRHHRHRSSGQDSRIPDENRSVSIRLPTTDDMQQLTKNDQVEVQILPQVNYLTIFEETFSCIISSCAGFACLDSVCLLRRNVYWIDMVFDRWLFDSSPRLLYRAGTN